MSRNTQVRLGLAAERIVDLTVMLGSATPVYPGHPATAIHHERLSPTGREAITVSELHVGMHTGTHVEGPRHHLEDGPALADSP